MRLISDFEDYYDKAVTEYLGDTSLEFNRLTGSNLDKVQQLRLLKSIGYETIHIEPLRGMVGIDKVLVYNNINLHYGAGKSIMNYTDATLMYGNNLATECFDTDMTYKLLQIGYDCYSLEVENIGLKENRLKSLIFVGRGLPGLKDKKYPMYSIDFVRSKSGRMLACDLDLCVRLDHIDGIKEKLPPEHVAERLYRYLTNRKCGCNE